MFGPQFSVPCVNVIPLLFPSNFLVLSVPRRVAVAIGCASLPAPSSWLFVSGAVLESSHSGCWPVVLQMRKGVTTDSDHKTYKKTSSWVLLQLCWGAGLALCCDREEELLLLFLMGASTSVWPVWCQIFSLSLENPFPTKSPVCTWAYWSTGNLMWKSFWSYSASTL